VLELAPLRYRPFTTKSLNFEAGNNLNFAQPSLE
jgi:hypothetical protein